MSEPTPIPPRPLPSRPFDERAFYLDEFRGRTLAFTALPGALDQNGAAAVRAVVEELLRNGTHVLLLLPSETDPVLVAGAERLSTQTTPFLPATWRALHGRRAVWVPIDTAPLLPTVRRLVGQLRAAKLVVLDPEGGLEPSDGLPSSFIDLTALRDRLRRGAGAREPVLREIEAALAGGETVNLCSAEGLDSELFSYTGSGTLFTTGRYVTVRPLGIDDLDVATSLIASGVEEGFLQQRSAAELDRVLATAYGAFIEDRHLAGIGALKLYESERVGELASLYTLTRFQGEGIGRHLIERVAVEASALGLAYVFACTTREAAARYFVREGFREISPTEVPPAKWAGYPDERRRQIRCFRRELLPSLHH